VAAKVSNGLDLQNQKIVNLADPSAAADGANKQYVDNVARGLDWKEAVRAATTANGALATAYENGDTLDGVVLATGNRILLKNQTTGAENGIYTVNASGAPTRALDADSSAEVTSGMAVTVTDGTVNGDKVFILTTNDPITLGSTALSFSQLGGGSTYTADELTLTLVGSQFSAKTGGITANELAANSVGSSEMADGSVELNTATVTGTLPLANGGTNATTAAAARASLAAVGVFAANIGDGAATQITVTHNLGTEDVHVQVRYAAGTKEYVIVDARTTGVNTVRIDFATAPASGEFRAIVMG